MLSEISMSLACSSKQSNFIPANCRLTLSRSDGQTFETATRNTLDLNAVALLKEETHLPVIVDPSHGTGRRSLVIPLSKAAVAVGADRLLIEVHPNPEEAYSDGEQSLMPYRFDAMMKELRVIAKAVGREL